MIRTVLILGSFSPGALEHQYLRGFKQHYWNVQYLNIQSHVNALKNKTKLTRILFRIRSAPFYASVNQEVLTNAAKIKPEVILVFKGMELYPETIRELKTYCKILCNYNPDHPFKFYSRGAGNSNVENSIVYYDIYFSYAKEICAQLKKKFQVKSCCIPFGFDDTIKPKQSKMEMLSERYLFVGAWDKQRERQLLQIKEQPLSLFGPEKWAKIQKVNSSEIIFAGYPIFGNDYADACYSAMGTLNFLRPQNILEQSHNMRTFEVPGYGGLLIAERTIEQQEFFDEDKEAIFFATIEELKDKLEFYHSRKGLVNKMKENAFYRSLKSGYSYEIRSSKLINTIKDHE